MMVELVLRLPIEAKTEAEAKQKFANQLKLTLSTVILEVIVKKLRVNICLWN